MTCFFMFTAKVTKLRLFADSENPRLSSRVRPHRWIIRGMNSEHVTLLLTITKILGAVFSGGFAVLGLITDFRDSATERITKWGHAAPIGIVASTAIAVASEALGAWKDRIASRESETATTEQLARASDRA